MWAEILPNKCPPEDAVTPLNLVYYRMVDSIPPTEIDFASQRALHPAKFFKDIDECVARSTSLFDSCNGCKSARDRRDGLKHKKIIEIKLSHDSGVIKNTFRQGHYSWWRFKEYDVSIHSRIADYE